MRREAWTMLDATRRTGRLRLQDHEGLPPMIVDVHPSGRQQAYVRDERQYPVTTMGPSMEVDLIAWKYRRIDQGETA